MRGHRAALAVAAAALAGAFAAVPARAAERTRPPVVASLTPAASQRLWLRLVRRRRAGRLPQRTTDCRPLRAVFYAQTDWLRLATKLAANASPCAQYYISVPPLAADKTALRSGQAWRIRALGPSFHALAEIQYAAWSRWVAAENGSWYDAGVEARRRMAAAGFDVSAGDTWALNELSSGVRRGDPGARQAVEEFLRGLYDGGGGSAPPVQGVVFDIGFAQSSPDLTTYKTALAGWLLDSGFWQTLSAYASDFAQEVYGDVRNEAVPGAPVDSRIQHLADYFAHPLALAGAGPPDVGAARSFLQARYLPLANAAWAWDSAYGYTDVPLAQMQDYVTAEVAALRTLGAASASGGDRFGFAWAPREPSGGSSTAQFASDSGALLDRLAAAIHDSDQAPTAACGTAWCTAGLPGAAFTEAWTTFSSWPEQLAVPAPPQLTAGEPARLTVELLTNGAQQPLPAPLQVSLSSSSAGAAFATSPGGPWSSALTLTIPAGASAASFYYSDPNVGTSTLTATAPGVLAASQPVAVGGAAPPPPDLRVALRASARVAPPVGSPLAFVATVSDASAGAASSATLQLTLPVGFAIGGITGASCTAAGRTLTCPLGPVTPATPAQLTVTGSVGTAGEQDAAALVSGAPGSGLSASLRLLPPPPKAVRRPQIAGRPIVGATLRAVPPSWNRRPTRVTYLWQVCTSRGCAPIRGATARRLRLRTAFAHRRVRVLATARFGTRRLAVPSRAVLIR